VLSTTAPILLFSVIRYRTPSLRVTLGILIGSLVAVAAAAVFEIHYTWSWRLAHDNLSLFEEELASPWWYTPYWRTLLAVPLAIFGYTSTITGCIWRIVYVQENVREGKPPC
jgi:hypothetical protein